jgi:hypothetical protein
MIRLLTLLFYLVRILLSRVGGGTGPMKPSNLLLLNLTHLNDLDDYNKWNFSDGANLMQG